MKRNHNHESLRSLAQCDPSWNPNVVFKTEIDGLNLMQRTYSSQDNFEKKKKKTLPPQIRGFTLIDFKTLSYRNHIQDSEVLAKG